MSETDRRSNLGRGLAALFGEEPDEVTPLDRLRATKDVPVEHLHPNRRQPRQVFDDEAIGELAESIKANGILQPILVRRSPDQPGEFEIVAGERRWRAAQQARLHEVPVVIRDLSDAQSLELALVENVQREDLNPLEEAEAYKRLIDEFGNRQEDLARVIGKSRSHVANTLRLLSLPDPVKAFLSEGRITAGHARAVLGMKDPEGAAKKVVAEGLNVRQTEAMAKPERRPDPPPKDRSGPQDVPVETSIRSKDPDTMALERDLSTLLGLKVTIDFTPGGGGSLSIRYHTLEQLDDLLRRLDHNRR